MNEVQQGFDRLNPWVTRFVFDGRSYGGAYHAADDGRLKLFEKHFPDTSRRVLELGCLEGGHTVEIAKRSSEVIAIEGRQENRKRAEWIAQITGTQNLQILDGNLETIDFDPLGVFDVCFNVGLLYHLPAPWLLLAKLARCCRAMFLWTRIAGKPGLWARITGKAVVTCGEYKGVIYHEFGQRDPLSGLSPKSFWPTHKELIRMLTDNGFAECETLELAHNNCIVKCNSTIVK